MPYAPCTEFLDPGSRHVDWIQGCPRPSTVVAFISSTLRRLKQFRVLLPGRRGDARGLQVFFDVV